MTEPTWREKARACIAEVVKQNPDARGGELKKLLFDAYPFGEKRNTPYKMWLEEVRKTLKNPAIGTNLRTFWTDPQ